jgi:hypothetical protein
MAQGEDGRRAGRPMKPIDEGLPVTVVAWLRLWRALVLEPLRAADPPWTLERMSAELSRRAGGERPGGGARGDVSGTAKPTLQRFFAGERVPARDVVQHLLDIAAETLDPPPAREQVTELWRAHRAALHTTFPLLAELYDSLDQRDAARSRAEGLQREKDRLTSDLALSRRQEQRAQALLAHAAAELEHAQQATVIQYEESRRAHAEAGELTVRVRDLEEQLEQCRRDQESVEQEIAVLREREHLSGVRSDRITELQRTLASVWEENEELAQMLRTITRALYDAQRRADEYHALGGQALEQQNQLTRPGPRSVPDRERQYAAALQAVEHLDEQLQTVSHDLAQARAELIRRDGDLARLVQEHAEEIASLRAGHVLAEADSVLSLALQSLDPAPAALPPAEDVPAGETTSAPSSVGVASAPGLAGPDSPPAQERGVREQEGGPPDERAEADVTAGDPPRHPHPGTGTASQTTVPTGETAVSRTSLRKKVGIAAVGLILVAALGLGIGWAMNRSGGNGDEPRNNSKSRSVSASGSATASSSATVSSSADVSESALLSKPTQDPVADIGDQEVNTAAVMKLRSCVKGDTIATVSPAENAFSGVLVDIGLEIKAAEAGRVPCRADAARSRVAITISRADNDEPVWDSAKCADGYEGHRWLEVTRNKPAAIDFEWDRVPNDTGCQQNTFAAAGTYLVETTILGKKVYTSFVLEDVSGSDGGGGFFGGPTG